MRFTISALRATWQSPSRPRSTRPTPMRSQRIGVGRVLRGLEGDCHVALSAEIVNLIRPYGLNHANEVGRIGQISVVKHQSAALRVGVFVQMVDSIGVERGGSTLDAMDLVTFGQQELCEISAVLAGYPG